MSGIAAHPDIETLSAYEDGELDPTAVARVERHCSTCGECREQLRRLRELVAVARALPHEIAPPPDVWTSLRQRTVATGAHAARPRRSWNAAWLAAAAVLLVAGGLLLRSSSPSKLGQAVVAAPPVPVVLASVDRSYAGTIADLRHTLETQRSTLSPATVRVLEHSAAVIDTAIAEARAALAVDPGNAALVEILAAQYEMKVDLLQRATKLSPSL